MEYFIDNTTELNINDLIAGTGDGLFKSPDKNVLNLGHTWKPVWICFSLDFSKYKGEEIILEIENELVSNIDIYYLNSNNVPIHFSETGFSRGFSLKNIPVRTFAWDLSSFFWKYNLLLYKNTIRII